MSIENTLERIAVALEKLAEARAGVNAEAKVEPKGKVEIKGVMLEGSAIDKPAPPAAPKAPPKPPTKPKAPVAPKAPTPPPAAALKPSDVNDALVTVLGKGIDRALIMAELEKFGVTSVNDLSEDQYEPLIAAVNALTGE